MIGRALLPVVSLLLAGADVRAAIPVATVNSVQVSVANVPVEVRLGRRGEQLLGPADFRRRASARANPIAPAGRYQDKVNTMLVASAGTQRLRLEGSVFNSHHGARLPQSAAARFSVRPADAVVMQVSYGSMLSTERHDRGARVSRMSASTSFTTKLSTATCATTALWGLSVPSTDEPLTNTVLLESGVDFDEHHAIFGRLEYLQRSAIELGVESERPLYDGASGSLGYLYAFSSFHALVPAVGVAASLDVVDARSAASRGGVQPTAMLFVRTIVN